MSNYLSCAGGVSHEEKRLNIQILFFNSPSAKIQNVCRDLVVSHLKQTGFVVEYQLVFSWRQQEFDQRGRRSETDLLASLVFERRPFCFQVGHEPLPPTVGTTMFGRRVFYLPGFFTYGE